MQNPFSTHERAFTRVELLCVVIAITVLAMVVAPAITTSKSDAGRMICFNNLRLVGRGVLTWAGDHNQQLSWQTPDTDGGTMSMGGLKPGVAWFEYVYLSNELVTPKILACPSDTGVVQVRTWSEFISSSFRAKAMSYALSLDGSTDAPRTWLSTDRNFRGELNPSGCSTRTHNTHRISTRVDPAMSTLAWTNAVHGPSGHVLTTDGAVEFTSTERLKELFLNPEVDDAGATHYLHGGVR